MSDILENAAPSQEVAQPAPSLDQPIADAAPEVNEVETRAQQMGWKPKDVYKGDPSKWVDAGEFVRRGEEELPILRQRNREFENRAREMERRLEKQEREFAATQQRQMEMTAIALRRQREQIEDSFVAAKRQAAEVGDVQRYDQLERGHREAVENFDNQVRGAAQPQQPQSNQPPPREVQAAIVKWQAENPWFFSDPGMNQYAQAVHMNLNETKPGLSIAENLAEVSRLVREQFGSKFGAPQPGRPAAVEGGNGLSGASPRSKGWNDIPAADRSIAEEFLKMGSHKGDRAAYAKSYWANT